MPMERITFLAPREELEAARRVCAALDRSLSYYTRKALAAAVAADTERLASGDKDGCRSVEVRSEARRSR